jgi:hypothetical protein
VGENAEERDERESHEDKRPEAQADPHGSPDAEEGARGEGQRRDDEFKEENGERELLEIIRRRARPGVPLRALRSVLFKIGRLGVRITP